ncbi:MAG: thiamine phosphate synthase [Muribaculaceae bacterium]|jgi:thiamine-phosphate pyrophosphorylase|nr:thiamine phosphate synthase [Muribaculaceae bacterium]
MLQFITHKSDRFSYAEQVKMVIEGGCRWVQLNMENATDDEFKKVAEEITPLCQETDTILVFDGRVELTMDMKVHGVHLHRTNMPAGQAREFLGAGAIIGVTVNTATEIMATRGLDVDYVTLACDLTTNDYKRIVNEVRIAGIELPIVAAGDISIQEIPQLLSDGVNGIALSKSIVDAENPVAFTREVISVLYGE